MPEQTKTVYTYDSHKMPLSGRVNEVTAYFAGEVGGEEMWFVYERKILKSERRRLYIIFDEFNPGPYFETLEDLAACVRKKQKMRVALEEYELSVFEEALKDYLQEETS